MDDGAGEKSLFEDIFRSIEGRGDDSGSSSPDIAAIDRAGRLISRAFDIVESLLEPGVTSSEIADEAALFLSLSGADPGMVIGISPENIAWHGRPGRRRLEKGHVVTVDIACSVRGWWADFARSFPVGQVDRKRRNLLYAAQEASLAVLALMQQGYRGKGVSEAVNEVCSRYDVRLVGEAAGHGIGLKLHDYPILTYDGRSHSPLSAGRAYTVEPIVTSGDGIVAISEAGEGITLDGEPSAHFELTVLALGGGYQLLGAPEWIHRKPC